MLDGDRTSASIVENTKTIMACNKIFGAVLDHTQIVKDVVYTAQLQPAFYKNNKTKRGC